LTPDPPMSIPSAVPCTEAIAVPSSSYPRGGNRTEDSSGAARPPFRGMARLAAAAAMSAAIPTAACTVPRDPAHTRTAAPPVTATGLALRRLPPASAARTEVATAAVGSRVYLIGGYRADGATVEVLDTASGSWDAARSCPYR
jgi:Kelch motif protein